MSIPAGTPVLLISTRWEVSESTTSSVSFGGYQAIPVGRPPGPNGLGIVARRFPPESKRRIEPSRSEVTQKVPSAPSRAIPWGAIPGKGKDPMRSPLAAASGVTAVIARSASPTGAARATLDDRGARGERDGRKVRSMESSEGRDGAGEPCAGILSPHRQRGDPRRAASAASSRTG